MGGGGVMEKWYKNGSVSGQLPTIRTIPHRVDIGPDE